MTIFLVNNNHLIWISSIQECLERNGMTDLYLNIPENRLLTINKKIFERLSDSFHQYAFAEIKKEKSKLRVYANFKEQIGFEKYLSTMKNPEKRAVITRFRLSNHKLMIEVGRHKHIPKQIRFCPFCSDCVETEFHFLFHCPLYRHVRDRFMKDITPTNPHITYYPDELKLRYLFLSSNHLFENYIINLTELRDFLLSHHKRHI